MASALRMEVCDLLLAFELAEPHVKKGGTYATRLAEQQEIALGLIDWAITESDRGEMLLKERAADAYTSKDGGHITLGPIG